MKSAIRSWLALSALASFALHPAFANENVGLYAQVELSGADFGYSGGWGEGNLADGSIITDGLLLDEGHQWNMGTVYWSGLAGADRVNVFLGREARVTSLLLQTDNNDSYLVRYRSGDSAWHDLATVYASGVWGMNTSTFMLDTPVNATAFALVGDGGDGKYALSEFQMNGSFDLAPPPPPVPEPSGVALLAAGLSALLLIARRRTLAVVRRR